MNCAAALALIKQHGIYGLAGSDGCLCANFNVMGVEVDIACRKSTGSMFSDHYGTVLRVTNRCLDSDPDGLKAIAVECANYLRAHGDVLVRFTTYDEDKDCKCSYCGKKRAPRGILCDQCLSGKDCWGDAIAPKYPLAEFVVLRTPHE